MPTFTERLAILIDAKTGGAVSEINKVGKSAKDLGTATGPASNALQKLGITGASSGAALSAGLGVAAFFAAGAVTKLGKDSVSAFTDLADTIRQVHQSAGGTTEDAGRLVAIFEGLGIETDKASTAMFRLNKNVAENQAKLESLGVVVAKNSSGTTDASATLVNIAKAYQGTADSAARAEIVQKAFGKGGTALLPILNATTEQLQELQREAARRGEIFTAKDEQSALNFEIQIRELGREFKSFEVQIGKAVVPTLGDAAAGLDVIAQKARNLPTPLTSFVSTLAKYASGIGIVVQGLAHIGHNSNEAATGLDQFAAAAQVAAQATKDAADAATAEANTVDGLVGSLRSYNSATDKVKSADNEIADAHDEVATKARDEADATDQAAKANRSLTSAQDALSKAQRDAPQNLARARSDAAKAADAEAEAVDAVTVAITKFGVGTKQAKAAEDALTAAKLDTIDATTKANDLAAAGDRPPDVVAAEDQIAAAKRDQATAAEAKLKADKEDPVADLLKAERDKSDALTDQDTTYRNLNSKLSEFNKGLGTSLTITDLMNGASDQMLRNLIEAETAQQNILTTSLATAAALDAQDAANRAAVVQGITGIPGIGNPVPLSGVGPSGSFVSTGPTTGGIGVGPTTFNNFTINVQSLSTANDIADEIAWLQRSHVQ